jgi:hypothetical protein
VAVAVVVVELAVPVQQEQFLYLAAQLPLATVP